MTTEDDAVAVAESPRGIVRDVSPTGPLGRLLLDPGRVVSSERLVEDVWDRRPPASAAKVLQKYVSAMRKLFPVPVLQRNYTAALALWRADVLADLPDLLAASSRGCDRSAGSGRSC